MEIQDAVPPSWQNVLIESAVLEQLEMRGSSMIKPNCPDNWCNAIDTFKWYNPAKKEKGVVISTGYMETGE
jgi:hypothetical protein